MTTTTTSPRARWLRAGVVIAVLQLAPLAQARILGPQGRVPRGMYRVASIQAGRVLGPRDLRRREPEIDTLIRQAASKGASLIVTPEHGVRGGRDRNPRKGDRPATDPRFQPRGVLSHYARLARELKVTLVVHATTADQEEVRLAEQKRYEKRNTRAGRATRSRRRAMPKLPIYSTAVAFNPEGEVVAAHRKFKLFHEPYKPGDNVDNSFFQTPAGKMGLLICADGQRAVNSTNVGKLDAAKLSKPDRLLNQYIREGVTGVCYPMMWVPFTRPDSPKAAKWAPLNVQRCVAKKLNTWVFGSNQTGHGRARGSGIFKPGGEAVVTTAAMDAEADARLHGHQKAQGRVWSVADEAAVLMADLPRQNR